MHKQRGIGAEKVTLYEKQIKGCSNGGRKRYLEKGGNNKLLNREWRQYLKCTKRGLKDMTSKDNAVVSSSVNNPLKEVVELLVEMTNREVTEQKRPWCHYGHFRVGPHVLTFPAIEDEWKLIGYIINEHLDGRAYHLWLRLRQTAKEKKVQIVHLASFFPPTLRLVIVIVNA
ncbi:hypothetical protein AB3S75_042958 [Citrus x aurantiifolia]